MSWLASLPHQIPFRAASAATRIDEKTIEGVYVCTANDVAAAGGDGGRGDGAARRRIGVREFASHGFLTGIDRCEVDRAIEPGDVIRFVVTLDAEFGGTFRFTGSGAIDGVEVIRGRFYLAVPMRKPDTSIRLAVTGVGIICSIGRNRDEVWRSIVESRAGIGKLTQFPGETFPTDIAAEVGRRSTSCCRSTARSEADVAQRSARGDRRERSDRAGERGATLRCRASARSSPPARRPADCSKARSFYFDRLVRGRSRAPASRVLQQPTSGPSDAVARALNLGGGVLSNATACASAGAAIGMAADLSALASRGRRHRRRQRRALPPHVQRLQRAAGRRSRIPARRSPRERKGITLGEGAAYLVHRALGRRGRARRDDPRGALRLRRDVRCASSDRAARRRPRRGGGDARRARRGGRDAATSTTSTRTAPARCSTTPRRRKRSSPRSATRRSGLVEQVVLRPHARRVRRRRSGDQRARAAAPARAADAAPRRRRGRLHARLHPAHAAADGDDERAVEHVRLRRLQRLAAFSARA